MNLVVAISMTLTSLMFLGYYPFFKKESEKKVVEGSMSKNRAESNVKKMKLGAMVLLALDLSC